MKPWMAKSEVEPVSREIAQVIVKQGIIVS